MNTFKKQLAVLAFFAFAFVAKVNASVATVYVFMSETCPICKSETVELKNLYKEYHAKGVEFVAVFPNLSVSTKESISAFAKKYQLDFTMQLDEGQKITERFSATVTPQVFVVNAGGELQYKGKIDNGFERVGKKRQVTSEHYLKAALDDLLANRSVSVKETEPVGCFIMKK